MNTPQSQSTDNKSKKYRFAVRIMTVAVFILLTIVLVLPGVLQLLYRADAQVALGNAKVVRHALQAVGTECYGQDADFGDAASKGGVTEKVYKEVLMQSKVPGDFWVLQFGEDGFTVESFLYREHGYSVYYEENPVSYKVYREEDYIITHLDGEE